MAKRQESYARLLRLIQTVIIATTILTVLTFTTGNKISRAQGNDKFNQQGNVLIADQFNNRVIEVDQNHNVVWQFGDGSKIPGPNSIV